MRQALVRGEVTCVLRAAVLGGHLSPGVIYSARGLASQLGVSSTPVREALLHLVNGGLMEAKPNKGFAVSTVSDQDRSDLVQLLVLLERHAVEAFPQLPPDCQLQSLSAVADEARTALLAGKPHEFLDRDDEFHRQLCLLSGSAHLADVVSSLRSRLRLYYVNNGVETTRLCELARDHEELLSLLMNRDRMPAVTLLEQHIAGGRGGDG